MPVKKETRRRTRKLDIANSFYSDIEMNNMLYAVLVRSPVSRGTIKQISHPALPEGYFLFSAKHVSGTNRIKTLNTETPVFASDEISYQGEPIAILAGPDKKQLEKLLPELDIRFGRSKDTQNNAEPTDKPGENVILARRSVYHANVDTDIETVYANTPFKAENVYTEQLQPLSCTEPNGCIAFFKGETLTICTPTKWITHLRTTVAAALGIDSDKIIVQKTLSADSGSNSIWYNAILAAQTAVAAKHTGKPVKLELSRAEQKKYMEKPLPVSIRHKTAADEAGNLKVMDIEITADAGAYNPFIQEIIDRMVIAAAGIYGPTILRIEATAYQSHTAPSGVHLQWADFQSFFAVENQMQEISQLTSVYPLEIRKKNRLPVETLKTAAPFYFEWGKMDTILDAVARNSDFNRKYASYHLTRTVQDTSAHIPVNLPYRGIGLSCAFTGSGFFGTSIYTANQSLEITLDTESTLFIQTYPPSPAICAIWKKIASDILSISPDAVKIGCNTESNEELPYPESILSNISMMTQLVRKCCTAIQKQRFRQPLPITIKRSVSRMQKKKWNTETFSGIPYHSTASGAAVVELAMDPNTFQEEITGIWLAIDGGEILSPKNAEETIRRGIQQILPELITDRTPQMPPVSITFVQNSGESKQIGDLIFALIPAAFTQALAQTAQQSIRSLPIMTDTVFRLIQTTKTTPSEEIEHEDSTDSK